MITVVCRNCQAPIKTFPSRKDRTKYCGRACYATWMSENLTGQKALRYQRFHSDESKAKMAATQKARKATGERNAAWKGGRHISRGYVMIALSTLDPAEQVQFESMATRSSNRCIPEHRLVMARMIGRPLIPSEVVHHLNGVKSDNRPENLAIHDDADHKHEHWQVLKTLQALRRENDLLRSELSKYCDVMCLLDGWATSPTPGK